MSVGDSTLRYCMQLNMSLPMCIRHTSIMQQCLACAVVRISYEPAIIRQADPLPYITLVTLQYVC